MAQISGLWITLTPIAIARISPGDSAWTEDVLMTPGIADLALNEVARTRANLGVTVRAVVTEVQHDGRRARSLGARSGKGAGGGCPETVDVSQAGQVLGCLFVCWLWNGCS